jgi:hypothetical protein
MANEIVDNSIGLITPARLRDVVETFAGDSTSTETANYTVQASDRGTTINVNSASAVSITVNSGILLAGQGFSVRQIGTGQVTIVGGTGMTLASSTGTFATRAQYSKIAVEAHTTATTLFVDGDLV